MNQIEPLAPAAPQVPTAMLDALLDESARLAEDVREWLLRRRAETAIQRPALLETLVEARESSRITARIGHVVAWLLARKAFAAGEIDATEALSPARRLNDREICLGAAAPDEVLPARLADLLARSERLYARIERLDRTLDAA